MALSLRHRPSATGVGVTRRVIVLPAIVALVVGLGFGWLLFHRASVPQKVQPAQPPYSLSGPTRLIGGVGVGFAHTEAGAVAAAAAYLVDLSEQTPSTVAARPALLATIAVPSSIPSLTTGMANTDRAVSSAFGLGSGGSFTMLPAALGTKVVIYTPAAATIDAYGVAVTIRQGNAASASIWNTSRLSLVWEAGDWKLSSEDSAPGPTVVPSTLQPAGGDPNSLLQGFGPVQP